LLRCDRFGLLRATARTRSLHQAFIIITSALQDSKSEIQLFSLAQSTMAQMSRKTPTGGSNNGGIRTSFTWLLWTVLLCGITTFIVSDRFSHPLEVSQLLLASIDNLNNAGMSSQPMILVEPSRQPPTTSRKSLLAVEPMTTTTPELEKRPKEPDSPEQPQPQQLEQQDASKPMQHHDITNGPKQLTALEALPGDTKLRLAVTRTLDGASSHGDTGDASHHKVYFLNQTQVNIKDSFSASWIMTKQDFFDHPLDKIKTCEDAAFKAWYYRFHKLRMTMDYLDFRYV
jgi:hypothetical protein